MDWKEQLNLIKLEKGGKNEFISDRSSDRNTSNGGSDFRNKISSKREQNIIKGGVRVITVEGALSDIDKLIEEAQTVGDKVAVYLLKAQKIVIKFLSTMRSNQLLTEDDKKRIATEKAKRVPKTVQK